MGIKQKKLRNISPNNSPVPEDSFHFPSSSSPVLMWAPWLPASTRAQGEGASAPIRQAAWFSQVGPEAIPRCRHHMGKEQRTERNSCQLPLGSGSLASKMARSISTRSLSPSLSLLGLGLGDGIKWRQEAHRPGWETSYSKAAISATVQGHECWLWRPNGIEDPQ